METDNEKKQDGKERKNENRYIHLFKDVSFEVIKMEGTRATVEFENPVDKTNNVVREFNVDFNIDGTLDQDKWNEKLVSEANRARFAMALDYENKKRLEGGKNRKRVISEISKMKGKLTLDDKPMDIARKRGGGIKSREYFQKLIDKAKSQEETDN